MVTKSTVMYEEDFNQIVTLCENLNRQANARAVLLVDRNGQFITSHGQVDHLDTTSLASLTAGNVAATSGLARLIGEKEFPNIFHEGERDNLHLSVVGHRAILVVMFDKRSSLGLVRLRVRRTTEALARIFEAMAQRDQEQGTRGPLADITDEDIDNLFK